MTSRVSSPCVELLYWLRFRLAVWAWLTCCFLPKEGVGDAIQACRDRGLAAALRSSAWVPSATRGLGAFEFDVGAVRQAVSSLSLARKARPRDADVLAALGTVLGCLAGQHDAAVATLREALQVAPQHYLALLSLGVMRDEVDTLRAATQYHPSRAEAHLALGEVLAGSAHGFSRSQRSEAKAAFLRALALRPNSRLVVGTTVEYLRTWEHEEEAMRIVDAAVARGLWRHPLQRPKFAYWSGLYSSLNIGTILEENCEWCRTMRIQIEAALRGKTLRQEFENARDAPEDEQLLSRYIVQNCDDEGLCSRKLGHAHGKGRGRWAEWSVWDPSRFATDMCGHNFPRMCDLVLKLLAQDISLVRMTITEVHPPETHIPVHSSPQQGRLRLLCPLVVPSGSISRLVFPGHSEKVYVSAEEGECWWFDESFEHELYYTGSAPRASLIVDVPHPSLLNATNELGLQLEAPNHPEKWQILHGALADMAADLGLIRDLWNNASNVLAHS